MKKEIKIKNMLVLSNFFIIWFQVRSNNFWNIGDNILIKFQPKVYTALIVVFGLVFLSLALYLNQTDFILTLLRNLDQAGASGKPP